MRHTAGFRIKIRQSGERAVRQCGKQTEGWESQRT